jgi:hypothetical protein
VIRHLFLFLLTFLILTSATFAVPDIQLFIDGATYDWEDQSWVASSVGSVNLYVISANDAKSDIIVCLALGSSDDPNAMSVDFGGTVIDPGDWVFGNPSLPPAWSPGNDLAPHSVYPTNFAEIHTGAYGLGMSVGDVQPDTLNGGEYWDPTATPEFPNAPANASGSWKMFTVNINGPVGSSLHFDAYTVNRDGSINQFAPFSHDATTNIVPEPGTMMLMGTGLLGLGMAAYRKRKRS